MPSRKAVFFLTSYNENPKAHDTENVLNVFFCLSQRKKIADICLRKWDLASNNPTTINIMWRSRRKEILFEKSRSLRNAGTSHKFTIKKEIADTDTSL